MIPHPSDFYVVHALFSGAAFPRGPVWGSLSDGPYDRTEALDAISDHFAKPGMVQPTLQNVRVYHFPDDAPARDVTEDMLAELQREMTDEERAEQWACDRADDANKLAREEAA